MGHNTFRRRRFKVAHYLPDWLWKSILLGFWRPGGVQVGWGVSEVQAAFVTTSTTMCY